MSDDTPLDGDEIHAILGAAIAGKPCPIAGVRADKMYADIKAEIAANPDMTVDIPSF